MLGTKEKYWIVVSEEDMGEKWYLFKIGRPGTGEDWAEKVACELCKKIALPCANYDFAYIDNTRGIVSERFTRLDESFIPANMLLSKIVEDYDGANKFEQIKYRLPTVINFLNGMGVDPPVFGHALPAVDYFIGYIVFDCLIGNTDRHHENWGFVVMPAGAGVKSRLAPTFDHASSLGRELNDEKRVQRLAAGVDPTRGIAAYARRARSAFFNMDTPPRTLTSREVMEDLMTLRPTETKFWASRIVHDLGSADFAHILGQVDHGLLSASARDFAVALLTFNQSMIREIADV